MRDTREFLIAKVEAGGLTPLEAEAEAALLGIGSLETSPDPDEFNPSREPYWTLPMAMAWIAYRTPDAVRRAWNEYRSQCRHWFYQDGWRSAEASGYRLVPLETASLLSLRLAEQLEDRTDRDSEYSASVDRALESLIIGLRSSCLEATGIASDTGVRETIPDLAWHELAIIETDGDVTRPRSGAGKSYRDILVEMRAVRGLWSVRPPEPERMTLPPLMRPEGGGYMPLYCAAQWIATEGGAIEFDPEETDRWRSAYADLTARIASDEVKVVGMSNGMREMVPGYHFAGIKVAYPFVVMPFELITSDEMYLHSYCFIDQDHWERGFDDSLYMHRGPKWSRLLVSKNDIAKLWPFAIRSETEPFDVAVYRTGAPGRPSSMHLVEAEFERRCASGLVEISLRKEAEALAAWLKSVHPMLRPATPGTIENSIRAAFRAHKNPRN